MTSENIATLIGVGVVYGVGSLFPVLAVGLIVRLLKIIK